MNEKCTTKLNYFFFKAAPRRSATNKKKMAIIISILTLVEIRVKRSGNPKHINSIAIGKHKILILQILF